MGPGQFDETTAYERIESTMTMNSNSTTNENFFERIVDEDRDDETKESRNETEKTLQENDVNQSHLSHLGKFQAFRQWFRETIVENTVFDGFILVVIVVGSIFMAMSDYSHVNEKNELQSEGSITNAIIIQSEVVFTVIFSTEFAMKAFALGFIGQGSYFYDTWNWLDFIVVFFALFSYYPGVPQISVFRIFRVLRPLKSVKSFPALAAIVKVLLESLVLMRDIFLVVCFLFLIFGIAGLQLFNGPYMHTRCRLTPYPVLLSFGNLTLVPDPYIVSNFTPYRCINDVNFDYPEEDVTMTKLSSPWATPHPECYWPIDDSDESFCSLNQQGSYYCDSGDKQLYCGSNYDGLGNPRFNAHTADEATFIGDLGYSYLNFDDLGHSMLTTFQIMAGDGWSDIMYLVSSCTQPITAGIFCVLLIMLGTFFVLQLIIATLENTLVSNEDKLEEEMQVEMEQRKEMQLQEKQRRLKEKEKKQREEKGKIQDSLSSSPDHTDLDTHIYCSERTLHRRLHRVCSIDSIEEEDEDDSRPVTPLPYDLDGEGGEDNDDDDDGLVEDGGVDMSLAGFGGNLKSGGGLLQPVTGTTTCTLSAMSLKYESEEDEDDDDPSVGSKGEMVEEQTVVQQWMAFIAKFDRPKEYSFRRACFHLCELTAFGAFFTTLILINTFVMAYDHHGLDQNTVDILDSITFCLTLCFTLELIIRLLGYGINEYFAETFNCFDFFIVIISMIDIGISPVPSLIPYIGNTEEQPPTAGSLSGLRSFRLLRLLRLFRSHSLQLLLYKVVNVILSMQSFVMLLFLYIFIIALIGMQFFSNKFRFLDDGTPALPITSDEWLDAPDRPRANFDDFTQAFATVFQVVTIDNWTAVMFDCMRAEGPWAALFPIFTIVAGSFVIMSMFLAILIHNFTRDDPSEEELGNTMGQDTQMDDNGSSQDDVEDDLSSQFSEIVDDHEEGDPATRSTLDESKQSSQRKQRVKYLKKFYSNTKKTLKNAHTKLIDCTTYVMDTTLLFIATAKTKFVECVPEPAMKWYFYATAKANDVIEHWLFENVVLLVILVSSIILAIDNPLIDPGSNLAKILILFDVIITFIFGSEMLLKMFAKGLFSNSTDDAYFSNGWNLLDFIVVGVAIISLAGDGNPSMEALKPLRALRALRPLRLVNRLPGLRAIVMALYGSMGAVAQISLVFCLIYFIFAIFFTSFLKGQIRSCQGDSFDNYISQDHHLLNLLTHPEFFDDLAPNQKEWFSPNSTLLRLVNPALAPTGCSDYMNYTSAIPVTSRMICTCWGSAWMKDSDFMYDNVYTSMITLFDAGTLDGWSELMHIATDSTGIDMQPIRDYSMWWVYIFVVFILLGNFLCVQLFVGVITNSFEKCKDEIGGLAFLTPAQQEWVKTRKIIQAIKPKRKNERPADSTCWGKIRGYCFDLCTSSPFDAFIFMCIVLTTVLLASKWFGMSDAEITVSENLTTLLTLVFTFEAIIKLIGLGRKNYFQDAWNCLDFSIAVCSVGSLINFYITKNNVGLIVNCLRILRVARLVRLVKGMPTLQKLVDTIVLTVPGIGNIAVLLFLFLYIFAVIAVSLFAKTAYYESYNEDANFRSFSIAFLTLIRFTTGDNWGQFMYDLSNAGTDNCEQDPSYMENTCGFDDGDNCTPLDGCGSFFIIFYMLLYNVLICFVFLSVFISVIISNYNEVNEVAIGPDDFQRFAEHWSEFDPRSTCEMSVDSLYLFIATLFAPFGFQGQPFSMRQYSKRVAKIVVQTGSHERKVHFSDVILALSAAHFERKNQWRDDVKFNIDKKGMKPLGKTRKIQIKEEEMKEKLKTAEEDKEKNDANSTFNVAANNSSHDDDVNVIEMTPSSPSRGLVRDTSTSGVSFASNDSNTKDSATMKSCGDKMIDSVQEHTKAADYIITVQHCLSVDLISTAWEARCEWKRQSHHNRQLLSNHIDTASPEHELLFSNRDTPTPPTPVYDVNASSGDGGIGKTGTGSIARIAEDVENHSIESPSPLKNGTNRKSIFANRNPVVLTCADDAMLIVDSLLSLSLGTNRVSQTRTILNADILAEVGRSEKYFKIKRTLEHASILYHQKMSSMQPDSGTDIGSPPHDRKTIRSVSATSGVSHSTAQSGESIDEINSCIGNRELPALYTDDIEPQDNLDYNSKLDDGGLNGSRPKRRETLKDAIRYALLVEEDGRDSEDNILDVTFDSKDDDVASVMTSSSSIMSMVAPTFFSPFAYRNSLTQFVLADQDTLDNGSKSDLLNIDLAKIEEDDEAARRREEERLMRSKEKMTMKMKKLGMDWWDDL